MIDWIFDNKACIVTGLGLIIISVSMRTFYTRKKEAAISQQASGDFLHSEPENTNERPKADDSGDTAYPSYRTEIKNGIKIIYKFDPVTGTETIVNTNLN